MLKKGSCGRCGFPIIKSTALKSRHTSNIYCTDIGECDRRSLHQWSLDEMDASVKHLWKEVMCLMT